MAFHCRISFFQVSLIGYGIDLRTLPVNRRKGPPVTATLKIAIKESKIIEKKFCLSSKEQQGGL